MRVSSYVQIEPVFNRRGEAAVHAPLGVARGAAARVRRGGGARLQRGRRGAEPGPRRRRLPRLRALRRRAPDRQGALQGQVSTPEVSCGCR